MTPKNQRAQKFGAKYAAQNGGVHIATLVSIVLLFSYLQILGFKCMFVPYVVGMSIEKLFDM